MPQANPVFVELTRADLVESRHRGACAVVDSTGTIVHAWGDVQALVYPRSSLKPLQVLPLIESGAAERFDLSDQEIALACASHNSEPFHITRVTAWLKRLGLSVDDLECGVCESISLDVTKAMSQSGEVFSRAHNNCSGKHAGFLTTAVHLGEPTKNYIQPDHPVQQRVTSALEDMTGTTLIAAPHGTDGCGIPVYALPLQAIATGMARMMAGGLGEVRTKSTRRVLSAMASCPHCIAGAKRFDTRVIEATKGDIVVKGGAEGVHIAMIPGKKLGIALKIDDGTIRASELAMGCVLDGLGLLNVESRQALADLIETPINTTLGDKAGVMRRGPGLTF